MVGQGNKVGEHGDALGTLQLVLNVVHLAVVDDQVDSLRKYLKGSSDVSTTMNIFVSLPNLKSLFVFLIF